MSDKKSLHSEFISMVRKQAEKSYPDYIEAQESFILGYLDSFILSLMNHPEVYNTVKHRVEYIKNRIQKDEVLDLTAVEVVEGGE